MAAAGTVVGPQEEKTQYRALQSGICQFQLQSAARGGICFSGFLSQPGAADFDVEVVLTPCMQVT